jgi:hypothetical protein
MGITIHYQGKINEVSLINKVTEELKDISEELEWKYHLIDDDKLNIKGIFINPPPDCEPLTFLFDKTTGILKHFILLSFDDMGEDHYRYNNVKTQFAPIHVHITIIKLLKYLKRQYMNDINVTDEGEYWETGDAQLLQSKFDFLEEMIDVVAGSFSKIEKKPGESEESLADRIEKILIEIHERNRNKHG